MKKLNSAVERFIYQHPRFGIPNLMKAIVIANAVVYVLACFAGYGAVSFLAFDWGAILKGELWRLITFAIMPGYYSRSEVLWLALFLYFYYMIGTALEREWGTAKFNLYYLSGVVLTLLVGIVSGVVFGGAYMEGLSYVNLSLFFAFAMLYPDAQFYVLYILPVKAKWLAWLDAAIFVLNVILNLVQMNIFGALLPVVALLNFFVFFWTELTDALAYRRGVSRRQTSAQTIQFKSAVRKQKKKEAERGYRHKCEVCGRTDAEFPDLEFRYCSRCEGYHCFCTDHIFNHEHFTK